MLPIRTVVCPLDFSEPSRKALDAAVELATQFDAELVLVHVVPPAVRAIPVDPSFAFTETEEYENTVRVNAEEELTLAAQRIPPELKSRKVIGTGDAADEIARIAETESADLIVISTHG